MNTIILFPGNNVSINKFLEGTTFIFDPSSKEENINLVIGHSLGILKAIIYIYNNLLTNVKLISLDGTTIDKERLQELTLSNQYAEDVKNTYLLIPDDFIANINMVLFCYTEKHHMNEENRKIITYTDKCGHYPFESARLLRLILKEIF